jgi:hypothetical protein
LNCQICESILLIAASWVARITGVCHQHSALHWRYFKYCHNKKIVLEEVEQTKVKYTQVGMHWDTPLNVNLNISKEKWDCKIGSMWGVIVWGVLVKEIKVRVYGGWTSYTYMKRNKETSCNCFKWGREGFEGERRWGQCTR